MRISTQHNSKKDPERALPITVEMLAYLLNDENVAVEKRAIQGATIVFGVGLQWLAALDGEKARAQKVWWDQLVTVKVGDFCAS